ncbi:unnamed protein product [Allacma fusca]|uniref:Uncharacterized protein n=1 Tax=Allacma fusca TaxID=39272 RepID=A0A8J2KQA4_9HEXA|nr:unnamed protein product [Allacma fusca]
MIVVATLQVQFAVTNSFYSRNTIEQWEIFMGEIRQLIGDLFKTSRDLSLGNVEFPVKKKGRRGRRGRRDRTSLPSNPFDILHPLQLFPTL